MMMMMNWWKKQTVFHTKASHSIDKIVEASHAEAEQVYTDEQGQLKVQVVTDWPINGGILGGKEYKRFFEWAKHLNNYHPNMKMYLSSTCPAT
jgi:hypothetical protein